MELRYVPLLQVQRDIQGIPRGKERFLQYLATLPDPEGTDDVIVPLVLANPMARDHVTALLDQLLALDADGAGARAAADAVERLRDLPGEFRVSAIVADDLMGGGTNRYTCEYELRFGPDAMRSRPTKRRWITAALWSSEPASERAVRESVLAAVFRLEHMLRKGQARTLREMLAQEGRALHLAGCAGPVLDAEDLAYTREVIAPLLEAEDMRTAIECLFGDDAARSLGFTPRGLSPWAGMALALEDARRV